MKNILAKDLKLKFVEVLNEISSFKYYEGNPFLIRIYGNDFYVFLKNLSPAYFKNSPDVTRIQLPYSDHFKLISQQEKPFIILGFDIDNDVFVAWNPDQIKKRLNYKQNVSLYSRNSFQSNVNLIEFFFGTLSNEEKIVLFKRNLLPEYFQKYKSLFDYRTIDRMVQNNDFDSDKLHSINETFVIEKLKPLLIRNKLLEGIEFCNNYYKEAYPKMTFRDWYKLVNDIYTELTN